MNRILPRSPLAKNRRGAAVAVIMLLVLAVTGLGLMSIRQAQEGITHGIVNTDAQRALQAADACAAAVVKFMPLAIDMILEDLRRTGVTPVFTDEMFNRYSYNTTFFGAQPFGLAPRVATCRAEFPVEDIREDLPAAGYSEGGGCFYRMTVRVTATLARTHASGTASADMQQNQSATTRRVIVRGKFGPASCD